MQKLHLKHSVGCFVLTSVILVLTACSATHVNTAQPNADHWITFDLNNAALHNDVATWQFELNRIGKYDIQVISHVEAKNSQPTVTPDIVLFIDGQQITSPLQPLVQIIDGDEPANVFQFQNVHQFIDTDPHTLTVQANNQLYSIRLVPNFKNAFGSGEYTKQWLKMHTSGPKQAALQWFKDARFGMFIHWGLYSQAAGSWQGTKIEDSTIPGPKVAEWLMYKFEISRPEYAELAKSFSPDKSYAQNIARLAKAVGMKYVVITSKHHDGFALFDSKVSQYDVIDATPYGADIVKELYDAVKAEGLEFGVYYSHGNDWNDGTDGNYHNVKKRNDSLGIYTHAQGKNLWDPSNNTHLDYLQNKAYPQIAELVNLFPDLRIVWFDGDGLITEKQAFDFYKLVYEMNPNILVNRRVGYEFGDYLDAGDNVIPSSKDTLSKHWETCGTTNNSWGFNAHDNNWKSTQEMLYYFIDITSKGGNYLLNIGPDGTGKVPETSELRLREMGTWIDTNQEAIFGTIPWIIQNEGHSQGTLQGTHHRAKRGFTRQFTQQDFWFTTKDMNVYAMSLVKPQGKVVIKSMNTSVGEIKSVRLLGSNRQLTWEQNMASLSLDFTNIETGHNGYALAVTFKQ
ncbi:MAG: alpha-L-fucosidase [Glaciecola sp.]